MAVIKTYFHSRIIKLNKTGLPTAAQLKDFAEMKHLVKFICTPGGY
ncbi:MAG: hypothetical protein NC120_13670 [Ruminococcus sp.]|nr:hypothetical protein [Ruminococcus sp.]